MESKPVKSPFKKKRYNIESRCSEIDWPSAIKKQSHSAHDYVPTQQNRDWESQHDVNQFEDEQR